jgi:hypothetical protein
VNLEVNSPWVSFCCLLLTTSAYHDNFYVTKQPYQHTQGVAPMFQKKRKLIDSVSLFDESSKPILLTDTLLDQKNTYDAMCQATTRV